jgi:hypothetical protein
MLFYGLYKTSYFNEEVNCTEPSPSVSIPGFDIEKYTLLKNVNTKTIQLN